MTSASGSNIPLDGVLHLDVTLANHVVKVPFLVANEKVTGLSEPILGYNVILSLSHINKSDMRHVLTTCLPVEHHSKVNVLLKEFTECKSDYLCNVKVGRQSVKIPGNSSITIRALLKVKNTPRI